MRQAKKLNRKSICYIKGITRCFSAHFCVAARLISLSLSLSRSLCLSLLSHNKAREHDWLTWVLFARQVVVVVVVFGGGFVVAFWNQQGVKVVWCKAVWRKRLSGWFWFNSWISTSSVNVKCLSPCRSTLHVTSQRRGYHATSCDIRSCHSLFCAVLECWQAWTSPRSALWAQQWTKRDACDQIVNLWQQKHMSCLGPMDFSFVTIISIWSCFDVCACQFFVDSLWFKMVTSTYGWGFADTTETLEFFLAGLETQKLRKAAWQIERTYDNTTSGLVSTSD